jgi:hypothetical protein
LDTETFQQNPLEPESENGYESDVTDSGSELSFGKTTVKASENDMSLKGLLGAFDSWPGAGTSASREGSLDGEKGTISAIPEDEDGLNDSSASKSGVDSSANQEVDGKKVMKSFWKDSDGGDEISSGSENVPPSFCNPMHGKYIGGSLGGKKICTFHFCNRVLILADCSFLIIIPFVCKKRIKLCVIMDCKITLFLISNNP